MDWKICTSADIDELAKLSMFLYEGEGLVPIDLIDAMERLGRWMALGYTAVLFRRDGKSVAYSLFRRTNKCSEELDSEIFIREFLVVRDEQKNDVGHRVFNVLCEQIWPANCSISLDMAVEDHQAQDFWRSVGLSANQSGFTGRSIE